MTNARSCRPAGVLTKTTRLFVIDVSRDVCDDAGKKGDLMLASVFRLLDSAMAAGREIFLVNYDDGVAIDPRLIDKVGGYAGLRYLPRKYPDGSPEIAEILGDGEADVFQLCGTFADACVAATAWGLAERFPAARIEVITDACIAVLGRFGWGYLLSAKPENITFVREDGTVVSDVAQLD